MADTEDYSEEATPSAHHESHEDEGTDEISLAGMPVVAPDVAPDTTHFDGILSPADDTVQKALDTTDDHGHAQLHDQNSDTILNEGGPYEVTAIAALEATQRMHTQGTDQSLGLGGPVEVLIDDAKSAVDLKHAELHATEHVTGGGDVVANAVAEGNAGLMTGADKEKLDTQMAIHEALPTVHQDAPDLILTHKGDASAHHAQAHTHDGDTLQLDGINSNGGAFTFNTTGDKTLNQRLILPDRPLFSAHITSNLADLTGDGTIYVLTGAIWTEITDRGGDFLNGTFTAPVTGDYLFCGCINFRGLTSSHSLQRLWLITSNFSYEHLGVISVPVSDYSAVPFTWIACMDGADTAYLQFVIYGGARVCDLQTTTYFQGTFLG